MSITTTYNVKYKWSFPNTGSWFIVSMYPSLQPATENNKVKEAGLCKRAAVRLHLRLFRLERHVRNSQNAECDLDHTLNLKWGGGEIKSDGKAKSLLPEKRRRKK